MWVVNIDGSHARQLTDRQTSPADWARWSPNGKRIVFANQRTSASGAIWTIKPDGSHLRTVYTGGVRQFPISPVWSPRGSRILFAADPNNDAFTHPSNKVYTISSRGGHPRLVDGSSGFKSQFDWAGRAP